MTAEEVLEAIRPLGKESYRRVIMNHGAEEPVWGVSIEDMKKVVKGVKKDYALSMALYNSGVYDAMYLAGLIADDTRMSREDLQAWLDQAYCRGIAEWTVAWVAAESLHGWEMALRWIDSSEDRVSACGWSTLGSLVSIKPDAELDFDALRGLLQRVQRSIHQAPNRTRYCMNGFVIAVGSYVAPLTGAALDAAAATGRVSVDMEETSCKVPGAVEAIEKVRARGSLGKKRKTARC